MKNRIQTLCLILAGLLLALPTLHAQSYSVDWHKIAGGGGTSTNGQYSVSGGYWSLINVVQTAGLPNLIITHAGSTVTVSWPNTGSYTLQQSANLASVNNWATSGYSITTANGTNSITLTSPTGNLFFRLSNP